jgi:hypothetical protein
MGSKRMRWKREWAKEDGEKGMRGKKQTRMLWEDRRVLLNKIKS